MQPPSPPTRGTSCTVDGPIGLNADEWPRFTGGWERRTRCALISGQEPVHLPPEEAGKGPKPRTVQPRGEHLHQPQGFWMGRCSDREQGAMLSSFFFSSKCQKIEKQCERQEEPSLPRVANVTFAIVTQE